MWNFNWYFETSVCHKVHVPLGPDYLLLIFSLSRSHLSGYASCVCKQISWVMLFCDLTGWLLCGHVHFGGNRLAAGFSLCDFGAPAISPTCLKVWWQCESPYCSFHFLQEHGTCMLFLIKIGNNKTKGNVKRMFAEYVNGLKMKPLLPKSSVWKMM